jgi:8-oxo-dGTP pyrophosphatase MutT (NUDIX family)
LFKIINSVKVILLNEDDEMLLMSADDPLTTSIEGKSHGRFWFPIGETIEKGETLEEAAIREIYEETGLAKEKFELGPVVWFGEFDYILKGVLTRQKEKYIVARTKQKNVSLTALDEWEQKVVQTIEWFSLEKINNSEEIIFPILLPKYLPEIISRKYPQKPIMIDLAKQPDKK